MPHIKQLSPHEAHKIAAGEVVERPVSVVKELIENALDAGASHIYVHVEQAGKKLIRVIDNGCGMDEHDAQLCFSHHATSKIESVNDLQHLTTFGFRGEALSSIDAVSTIELTTKEISAVHGTHMIRQAGTIKHRGTVACNHGTDIAVRDLFFNIPARHKFLRSDETEWRQIMHLFHAYAFAYPTITWTLTHDGVSIHHCPAASDLITRSHQLWDAAITQHLIPLVSPTQATPYAISGFISSHHYARFDRNSIYIFVNNRWVKNNHLIKAVVKGYANVLPDSKFPAACLMVSCNPDVIDINIHPRKEEILFLNPRQAEQHVQHQVKKTLEQHIAALVAPIPQSIATKFDFDAPVFAQELTDSVATPSPHASFPPLSPVAQQGTASHATSVSPAPDLAGAQPVHTPMHQQSVDKGLAHPVLIGQLHKTYLVLEHEQGLLLVDQHAAHERILYERFGSRLEDRASTRLLFPQIITRSVTDYQLLIPHLPLLHGIGIDIEIFGERELLVTALPVHAQNLDVAHVLDNVIAWLNEARTLSQEELATVITEKIRAQMACKAAVKAGDALSSEHMHQLLRDLATTQNRFSCPHGRPTSWLITLYDIEKKFKRTL